MDIAHLSDGELTIYNIVSPALHEFFDSLHHTVRQTIEPLTNDIPKSTAEKIKLCMLELQDTARRDDMQSATGAAVSTSPPRTRDGGRGSVLLMPCSHFTSS